MTTFKTATRALAFALLCMGALTTATTAQTADATELAFWQSVGSSGNVKMLQAYLDSYPDGSFVPLAHILIEDLGGDAAPAPQPKTQPEPKPEPETLTLTAAAEAAAQCETLAAHPEDTTSALPGVAIKQLKTQADAAIDACLEALQDGAPTHAFSLGRAYYAAGDMANTATYFAQAAAQGHVLATYWMGIGYRDGDFDLEKDWRKALPYFERPTQKDHGDSQLALGQIYAWQSQDAAQKNQALEVLNHAWGLGKSRAVLDIAKMYETGTGVFKDVNEAKWHYRMIAGSTSDPDSGILGGFHLARLYFAESDFLAYAVQRIDSIALGADSRRTMIDHLAAARTVYPEAHDLLVKELRRSMDQAIETVVEEFSRKTFKNKAMQGEALANWEFVADLRLTYAKELKAALIKRYASNPRKFKDSKPGKVEAAFENLLAEMATSDIWLAKNATPAYLAQEFFEEKNAGNKCLTSKFTLTGVDLSLVFTNNCKVALSIEGHFHGHRNNAQKEDHFSRNVGAYRNVTFTTKTAANPTRKLTPKVRHSYCPAFPGFSDKDGSSNCISPDARWLTRNTLKPLTPHRNTIYKMSGE